MVHMRPRHRSVVFATALALLVLLSAHPVWAQDNARTTLANVPVELVFTSARMHDDAATTMTVDLMVTNPSGVACRVPGFWDGTTTWKVRYASPTPGTYHWRTDCSDPTDAGLHAVAGTLVITPYQGSNPLFQHGPIQVAPDKRHFMHADGTPFFWLGDTWWMGLCTRLHWPDEVHQLAADRLSKGFTVIQIVAGLYPDMNPFDPRGANEAGYPWEADYAAIRPQYFDAADQRLQYLIDQGLSPCIVGAWGYFLPWMGVAKAKLHWRNLIARYGAYPVVWCVAGEANLPWYLAKGFPYDDRDVVHGWTEVARYLRATDPFHRLVTIHPTGLGPLNARHAIDDETLLDFDMLQTPHGEAGAIAPTVTAVNHSYQSTPVMPTLDGEASYEMLGDHIAAAWPRAMFWLCMMNGAAGHTYGANGIWQCNRVGQPHGKSPHGGTYGVISWDQAMVLPGSQQIGWGKRFLCTLPWSELTPMPGTAVWADEGQWGDWIWFNEGDPAQDAPVAARFFRRVFTLSEGAAVRSAVLRISADDRFTAYLNGHEVGSGAAWNAPGRFDVGAHLKPGVNVLCVRGENVAAAVAANPAGLIASLSINDGGTAVLVRSDAHWRASQAEAPGWLEAGFDDAAWTPARIAAPYGQGPWGTVFTSSPPQGPFACGIGDRLRLAYALSARSLVLHALAPHASYVLTTFDPVTGARSAESAVQTDATGSFLCTAPADQHDWVVLLSRTSIPVPATP
jgi:hypothetical protein